MRYYSDKTAIVAMPTLTLALKSEALLGAGGIYGRVVKLPAGATKRGCAYGLEVGRHFLEGAVKRIEAEGIKHGEILY